MPCGLILLLRGSVCALQQELDLDTSATGALARSALEELRVRSMLFGAMHCQCGAGSPARPLYKQRMSALVTVRRARQQCCDLAACSMWRRMRALADQLSTRARASVRANGWCTAQACVSAPGVWRHVPWMLSMVSGCATEHSVDQDTCTSKRCTGPGRARFASGCLPHHV